MAGKNKKTKKVKNITKKVNKKVVASIPTEWYYMSPEEISVADLQDILTDESLDIHVWKEMGILEIGFSGEDAGSLDVETCELDLGDDYSNEFLKEHQVKSLFYMTFKPEDENNSVKVMESFVKNKGGLCCADTEDFTPTIM